MSKNNKMAHKKREKRTVSSEILCAHIKNLKFSLLEEKKLLFMTVNNWGSIFVKIDRKCIDVKWVFCAYAAAALSLIYTRREEKFEMNLMCWKLDQNIFAGSIKWYWHEIHVWIARQFRGPFLWRWCGFSRWKIKF